MPNASGLYEGDDLNRHYVRKIREMPLLTLEDEYTLAKKWRDEGDAQAVKQLVESHLRLVAKVAKGYRGYGLPVSDLIAEGNIGMMQAMKHYDPERGFRLSTYALWWIRASIQEYILHTWSMVKMGTTSAQKKLFFSLRKAQQHLHTDEKGGMTPEMVTAIATKLSVREDEVLQMNSRLSGDRSLNVSIKASEEGSPEWIEWLEDEREDQEMQVIQADEIAKRRTLLEKALTGLTEREHQVFTQRRLKDPPQTLEAISMDMGISRERVRQIENSAFEKISKKIKRLATAHYHNI